MMAACFVGLILFQSAPPCGGDLPVKVGKDESIIVSIRAPVWGRSSIHQIRKEENEVSIRAPVWGRSIDR